jgi:purine-cytosine permease-like protein
MTDDPHKEAHLNRLEASLALVYSVLWATAAAAIARIADPSTTTKLTLLGGVSPTVASFGTVFFLALIGHLVAASKRVPRVVLSEDDRARLAGFVLGALLLLGLSALSQPRIR